MTEIKYSHQVREILADPVRAEITACKVKFLMESPFIGQIATSLESIEAPWCRTGATDGRNLYWNREFMKSLNRDQKLFFIAHEIYHICFPPGTMIAGDCRPIEYYEEGDSLIGIGGTRSTVTATMENHYDGDLITIKPRGMLPLSMTDSHPILVSRPVWKTVEAKYSPTGTRTNIRVWSEPEWVSAKDLKKDDWVQIPRVKGSITDYEMDFEFLANKWSSPEKIQGKIVLDEKLARFIGYYVAEGSTSTTNNDHYSVLALNASEREECEELKSFLFEYFGISSNIQSAGPNGIKLQFSSAPFGRWLIKHCGKGAHNKKIPECILYNTDLKILESFLHAYVCGDGNVNDRYGVHSATVSKSLALQAQLAWARLGVFSNITFNKNNGGVIKTTGQVIKSGFIHKLTTKANTALALFGLKNSVKRPTKHFRITDDAIWVPIKKLSRHSYSGLVYNLETSCHTYAVQSIMTHNCFDHIGRRGSRDPDIWNMACLAWDTPILMADGSCQPIQRVLPGDYIASPFGPNKVLGNMFSGTKNVRVFQYKNENVAFPITITATPDHKFFSGDDFLEAGFISNNKKNVWYTKESSEIFGYGCEKRIAMENALRNAADGGKPILFVREGYDGFRVSRDCDYPEIDCNQKSAREFKNVCSAEYISRLTGNLNSYKEATLSLHSSSATEQPVFDLVTKFGAFFANGILTHNCDYNINYALKRENIGAAPTKDGKEIILYDERYTDDMSAYEIYDLLIENSTTIELPLDDHLDLASGQDDDDDGSDGENGKGSESDSADGDNPGDGDGKKKKTAKMRVLGKNGPPKLSKEELEKLRQEMRSMIISAAQQAGAGGIPAGLRKMISELLEPKLDWRNLLDAYIRSSVKDDYSFQNVSRRSWGLSGGAILPGQKFTERVEVFCAIDASGSTTATMMASFVSELLSICQTFPDYKIDIISFDTEVYNHIIIKPDNIDDLREYEIRGNGGTMFEAVFEFMKRESIEPERLVILTDGLPNAGWGDPNYADTIFIIHSNPHIVAPFGLTAHIYADDKMFRKTN